MMRVIKAALWSVAISATASANSYIALNKGDTLVYQSKGQKSLHPVTVQEANANGWRKYSNFLDTSYPLWLWSDANSEAVFIAGSEGGHATRLIDFNDPVGTIYTHLAFFMCADKVKIVQKGLTINTPAGTFSDVVMVRFYSDDYHCYDAGLLGAYFAPKVGLISWWENNIGGEVRYDLASVQLSPSAEPTFDGVKVTPIIPKNRLKLGRDKEEIEIGLDIENISGQDMQIHFPSEQEFEITLGKEVQKPVLRWSDGKQFAAQPHTINLKFGERYRLSGTLPLRLADGSKPALGNYHVSITAKGSVHALGAEIDAKKLQTEAIVSISQYMNLKPR